MTSSVAECMSTADLTGVLPKQETGSCPEDLLEVIGRQDAIIERLVGWCQSLEDQAATHQKVLAGYEQTVCRDETTASPLDADIVTLKVASKRTAKERALRANILKEKLDEAAEAKVKDAKCHAAQSSLLDASLAEGLSQSFSQRPASARSHKVVARHPTPKARAECATANRNRGDQSANASRTSASSTARAHATTPRRNGLDTPRQGTPLCRSSSSKSTVGGRGASARSAVASQGGRLSERDLIYARTSEKESIREGGSSLSCAARRNMRPGSPTRPGSPEKKDAQKSPARARSRSSDGDKCFERKAFPEAARPTNKQVSKTQSAAQLRDQQARADVAATPSRFRWLTPANGRGSLRTGVSKKEPETPRRLGKNAQFAASGASLETTASAKNSACAPVASQQTRSASPPLDSRRRLSRPGSPSQPVRSDTGSASPPANSRQSLARHERAATEPHRNRLQAVPVHQHCAESTDADVCDTNLSSSDMHGPLSSRSSDGDHTPRYVVPRSSFAPPKRAVPAVEVEVEVVNRNLQPDSSHQQSRVSPRPGASNHSSSSFRAPLGSSPGSPTRTGAVGPSRGPTFGSRCNRSARPLQCAS
jgi:hypothetical protein